MTALDDVNSRSPSNSYLTYGISSAVSTVSTFPSKASALSCICVIIILIWICRNVYWYRTFPNGNWKLFQGPIDVYMFSLFVFDLFQAIGGILNISWRESDGVVQTGKERGRGVDNGSTRRSLRAERHASKRKRKGKKS